MHIIITFPKEISTLVVQETEKLGGMILDVQDSSLLCEVDEVTFYRMHLYHSLADQIHFRLRSIPARSPEMVFDHIKKIKWYEYLNPRRPYSLKFNNFRTEKVHQETEFKKKEVEVQESGDQSNNESSHHEHRNHHRHQNDRGSRWQQLLFKKINQGIWDTFKYSQGLTPRTQRFADQVIEVHQEGGGKRLSIALNTSGRPFFKQGFKPKEELTPLHLKENIASALLKYMDYHGDHPDEVLWDPFCGGGTIAIEGVYESLQKAPHTHRPRGSFGFENYLFFNRGLWREIQEDARKNRYTKLGAPVFASDYDENKIEEAKENALNAKVDRYIEWNKKDFFEIKAKGPRSDVNQGILISQLPITEDQSDEDSAQFFKKLGEHIKDHLDGWRIGFLVPKNSPWKEININPDEVLPINNQGKDFDFLIFN